MSEKADAMECVKARELFPAFDEQKFPPEVLGHLEGCEECKAELSEFRALSAGLGSLATADIQPPSWLLGAIIERVAETARRRAVVEGARRQMGRVTTGASRQLGEHRVATGSALGLAMLAGALLFGRTRKHGVKAAA